MSRAAPRRFTPSEDEIITKHLPTKGHKWVAEQLNRTHGSVWHRAKKIGVNFGDVPGWTRITHLAAATGQDISSIYNKAKRERALRRVGPPRKRGRAYGRGTAAIVSNKWADRHLETHNAERQAHQLREREGWLTLGETAAILKIGKSTVNRAVHGRGLIADLMSGIERVRATSPNHHGQWLLEPYGVHTVARELQRQRQKARSMVSTKSLAVEYGVKQTYAADIGKKEFGGIHLFVHGRIMCHVTPQAAEIMRRRFAEGVTPGKRLGRPTTPHTLRRAA